MKTIYFCHDQQAGTDGRLTDLEMAGYRVKRFQTGGDLTRAIAQEYPDLVLLDVLVSGKNGFEVCAGMDLVDSHRFPVMLFGGVYSRSSFREHAMALGVTAFVEGAPTSMELLNHVNREIRRFERESNERSNVA
ncbi:MAG: response regulator [Planctomycetota bacterium]|nr:response regulator [Planctomycetota bacterium]